MFVPIDNKNAYFKKYLNLIKNNLDEEWKYIKGIDKKIKEGLIKVTVFEDGSSHDPSDDVADMAFEIKEMEQLMYRTYIIGVFVFMESQVTRVCNYVQKIHSETFSHTDLRGVGGVERSVKYLESVLGVKFPTDQTVRDDFEVAKIIRNACVHKEGEIKEGEESKIRAYIAKHPKTISLDERFRAKKIEITHTYAESLVTLNQKICAEVEKYRKEIK